MLIRSADMWSAVYLMDMLDTISVCILCYFYFLPLLILLLVQG